MSGSDGMPKPEQRQGRGRARGLALMVICIVMWALGPLFVKHFTNYYDVWTQNSFRYGCAALILLAATGLRGHLRYPLTRGQWGKLCMVTVANLALQVCFASAYYFIYPAVGTLVARVNIIFITVLSFLIFHDERRVIRSPRFLIGAVLALAGVLLVILARDPALLEHLEVGESDFWIGIALVVAFAFFYSLYALAIKHAVSDIPPLISFTHVAWMTAVGLCLPMLAVGGVADLWRQPVLPLGLMALSALLCIVIAHTCYYAALREIKAVVSSSMLQLSPVITCAASALVYGDTLTPLQILGGVAVIAGAWLAALAQTREDTPKPAP